MTNRLQELHDAGLYLRAQRGEPLAKLAWLSMAKTVGGAALKRGGGALGWLFQPGKIGKRALPLGVGLLGGGSAIAGGVQAAKQVKPVRGPVPPTYAA